MNDEEWTDEERRRIVCINLEERQKGKNFTKSIKNRMDSEFLGKRREAKNLVYNAGRFEKEKWGREMVTNQT